MGKQEVRLTMYRPIDGRPGSNIIDVRSLRVLVSKISNNDIYDEDQVVWSTSDQVPSWNKEDLKISRKNI